MLNLVYFVNLAKKIYLSPSESALSKCLEFVRDANDDVELLKAIDTSSESLHHFINHVELEYDELSRWTFSEEVENSSLLKSLLEDYAISNIKKA